MDNLIFELQMGIFDTYKNKQVTRNIQHNNMNFQ